MDDLPPWNIKLEVSLEGLKGRKFAKAFGRRLEDVRRSRNLTLTYVSRATGFTTPRETLGRYETGQCLPTVRVLVRLAQAMGVQPGDLLPRLNG